MTPRSPTSLLSSDEPSRLPGWATACFLASGAAGLIYEVVWSKQFAYLLGNSLQAVATVVAAFLTGLALGAYVVGTRVARRRRGAGPAPEAAAGGPPSRERAASSAMPPGDRASGSEAGPEPGRPAAGGSWRGSA
ncbi:MAG TPA: hypothetical protein VMS88_03730 [Terriglobales bacterium]|nr:hypothetical protein [Terriglobales bacterium]